MEKELTMRMLIKLMKQQKYWFWLAIIPIQLILTGSEGCPMSEDQDGDSYTVAAGDCDDANPAVNPGARSTR
jgi:hypothetical protein